MKSCAQVFALGAFECILRTTKGSILAGNALHHTFVSPCSLRTHYRRGSRSGGTKAHKLGFLFHLGEAKRRVEEGIRLPGEIVSLGELRELGWLPAVCHVAAGLSGQGPGGAGWTGRTAGMAGGGCASRGVPKGSILEKPQPQRAPQAEPRPARPAGDRHSPSLGTSPATLACPGC